MKLRLFVLILFLINPSPLLGQTTQKPLTAVTIASGEWSPYTSRHLYGGGILSQIVSEAFALDNIEVKYNGSELLNLTALNSK